MQGYRPELLPHYAESWVQGTLVGLVAPGPLLGHMLPSASLSAVAGEMLGWK